MDWIKFGWGPKFDAEFNSTIPHYVDMSNAVKSTKSLLEISNRVIDNITQNYPEPYTLMVSGGMDSQMMLWCWLNSGKSFNAVSIKYVSDDQLLVLNQHDLVELDMFANKNNIPINYRHFNVTQFLENDLLNCATEYQCTSPQICTYMAMSELIHDGTIIFSGNFAYGLNYSYTIWGMKRYAEKSGKNIIPFFLLHDSELANLPVNLPSNSQYSLTKFNSYTDLGVPVIPQPKKQTGFEVIKDYYDSRKDLVVPPKIRLKYANMPSKRKFDLLFRYSLMEKIKYVDNVVYIRPKQQ